MKSRIIVIISIILSLIGSAINVKTVDAASFSVSNTTELINAINTANTNNAADTITITANITLTTIDNYTYGENGLPVIQPDGGNALTIDGNGFTLSRSSAVGTPNFRIIEVASGAQLTLQNITLSNGICIECFAGAIENRGILYITNSTLSDFYSSYTSILAHGGALSNSGDLTITNSTFDNNKANGGVGGAIDNRAGSMLITNSTFVSNNSAYGGAIFNDAVMQVANSSFIDNYASQEGGGFLNYTSGSAVISNSTFSENGASIGGNIRNNSLSLTLKNTILATTGFLQENCSDVYGTTTAGADNLATDLTCDSATPVTSTLLKLSPSLADNGGPTQTLALLPGSAAIDAGNATTCATAPVNGIDQRGVTRPFGAGCDVGAYEFDGSIPSVTITADSYTVNEQTVLNLHGTGISVNDLDGDPLTVTVNAADASAKLVATVGTTSVIIISGNGTNTLELSGTIAQLNTFFAGHSGAALTFLLVDDSPSLSVTLSVTANDGSYSENDTAAIITTPVNDPPVNSVPGSQATTEDTSLVFSAGNGNMISISDLDVSSNTLEVILAVTNGTITLAGSTGLNFSTGDGTADSTMTFTGSLSNINNALAALTFNPTMNYYGTAVLSIITNDLGNTGTGGELIDDDAVNITIISNNDLPTVANAIPNQNATEDTAFTYTFPAHTFNDPDTGDTLTYSTQLAGGSALPAWVSFDPVTRTFSGTPSNADVGTITIEVTATDGSGETAKDIFDLVVMNVNNPPVIVIPIPNQNATEDAAFNYMFPANTFNDLDTGDTLTYSAQLASVSALPAWVSFDPVTRTFSGTPSNTDVGTITIEVTATDGSGEKAKDNFDLVVMNVNDPPVIVVPIPNQTATENTLFNFTFAANTFSDPDTGDTLTYSAQLTGGGPIPAWVSFDPVTRTLSGTPLNSDIGTVSIDIIASDSNGGSVTDTFDIIIIPANSNPYLANPIPNQNAAEDFAFNYTFPANTFGDPDFGTTFTYTAHLADGSILPAWLSFDPSTRTFSGTPLNSNVGIVTIKVTADDGTGGTVSDNFDIQVANTNDAPIIALPIPDQIAAKNLLFNYQFPVNSFSDPDLGDTLTHSAQLSGGGALPVWLSFDAAIRTFSGTPTAADFGVVSIDIIASDGNGGTVTDTFTIAVNGPAPVITSVNTTNLNGTYIFGDAISITVTFDQFVTVDTANGLPTILLETGATDRTAAYLSGSGTNILTFRYIVQTGDATVDLDYPSTSALALNGGTIRSASATPSILTLPNPGGAASIAGQHAIVIDGNAFGVSSTSLVPSYTTGPSAFTIIFDYEVNDPAGDTDPDDVTNPANYLLVEDGANDIFDTTTCLSGLTSDDTQIPVASVSYSSKSAFVILTTPPTNGTYRLFVCGTTSIVDLTGNPISGNGVTPGTDYIFDFVVAATAGTPVDVENIRTDNLPQTGFAPSKMTVLPKQTGTLGYTEYGDIWLDIPSLNVKMSIVGVPQQTMGEWDVTWLGNDAGWLNGTAYPTWNGNSVITAHVTNASGLDGPFANLKSLEFDDQIIIHMGGTKHIYEVRDSKLVRPSSTKYAFESLKDYSYITLITCQNFDPDSGTYLFRRVVRAVLVSVEDE